MKTKFNGILTLLLAFVVQLTFAQSKTISGTVSDGSDSLPGVNVIIKGTTTGTETDFDGNYSITANVGDILQYSFVGMETSEKTIGGANTINVTLESSNILDEVVITALGIKRKPDEITTSNQVVKAEDFTKAEVPTVTEGLIGKVSGLQINTTSQGARPGTNINLRGLRSLTGNNSALVVIDGAISSSTILNALNPKTIASVNVIKGANGAALYGSAGSNGVIIVTTNSGSTDEKFKITIGTSLQAQEVAYLPERQTTWGQGWGQGLDLNENGGWGPVLDGSIQPIGVALPGYTQMYAPFVGNADNIKEFFQTGFQKKYDFGLSTGSLESGFVNLSIGRLDVTSIIPKETYKRSTFTLKSGKKIGDVTVEGSFSYISDSDNNASQESTRGDNSVYGALLQTPTNIPLSAFSNIEGDDRNYRHWNGYYLSPYWVLDNVRTKQNRGVLNSTLNLGYDINENINVSILGNVNTRNSNWQYKRNSFTDNPANVSDRSVISRYSVANTNTTSIYSNFKVNLDYMLTDDISFKANIGGDVRDYTYNYLYSSIFNLTFEDLDNISSGTGEPIVTDSKYKSRSLGAFGNFDFGYKNYLYLNLTARNDWSSTLSPDNNSFFYPSAGISFIPTNAFSGLKSDIINKIKLRYSYVEVGNNRAGIGAIESTLVQPDNYPFGNLNSFRPNRFITDPNLKPEFIQSNEIGLNMELFKRKVTLDVSAYTSKNTDQVVRIAPSFSTGVQSSSINIGQTTSKGLEIDLGFTPIKNENFSWDMMFSYATNKTIVDKLTPSSNELVISSVGAVDIVAITGEEFPLIKGTAYERDTQGRVIVDAVSGNPLVTSNNQVLGKSTPDYILGFNSALNYKGFTLSTTLDFRTGHSVYSSTKAELMRNGLAVETTLSGRTGFIFPNSSISDGNGGYIENTNVVTGGTTYNSLVSYYTNQHQGVAENSMIDATALKVREISLAYNLPEQFLNPINLSSLSISVIARNPFVILAKGNRGFVDPEFSSSGNSNAAGATRYDLLPPTKYYGLSVNLSL